MPNRKRSRPASFFRCNMLRPWAIAKCAGANHSLKVNIWERLTNPTVNSAQHFGSRLVLISGSLASVNGCRSGRIYDRDRSSSKPKFKERAREAQTYPAFQGLLAAGGSTRSPFRPSGALGLKNKGATGRNLGQPDRARMERHGGLPNGRHAPEPSGRAGPAEQPRRT